MDGKAKFPAGEKPGPNPFPNVLSTFSRVSIMIFSTTRARTALRAFHLFKNLRVSITAIAISLLLFAPSLLTPLSPVRAQPGKQTPKFTITRDPQNPKRKIYRFPKQTRTVQPITVTRNLLDTPGFRRAPIPFQKFEMVNPKTGKAINPAAKITLPGPDGKPGPTMTVQQYFDQLNTVETELTKRGHSLRNPATFLNVRPDFQRARFDAANRTPAGFRSVSPSMFEVRRAKAAAEKATAPPIIIPGKVNENPTPSYGLIGRPTLYVGEQYDNFGTTEFPVTWAGATLKSDRRNYLFLTEVPDGIVPLAKKIEWQISAAPFPTDGGAVSPSVILKSGVAPVENWRPVVRGYTPKKGKQVSPFTIDFSVFGPPVKDQTRMYYVRVSLLGADGKRLASPSPGVIVNYGMGEPVTFDVVGQQSNESPTFNYRYPDEENVPFGVFLEGNGLRTVKNVQYSKKLGEIPLGFKATANAAIGFRYYNFERIVDESKPFNKRFDVLGVSFRAVAGVGTGTGAKKNEPQEVTLDVTRFGVVTNILGYSGPAIPESIPLDFDIVEPIDWTLVDVTILLGPIPIRIVATVTGELGVRLSGIINLAPPFNMTAALTPFVHSRFDASGGPDLLIAYGKLAAELNPLLNADAILAFNSSAKNPVSLTNSISGLKGRVYLVAGFYHPCPPIKQVKKLIGFITGDDDCPLCETKWEYNIFDWQGLNDTSAYN